jgi:superfamily II DNA or RNA helicase
MNLNNPSKTDVMSAIATAKGIQSLASDLQNHYNQNQNDLRRYVSNIKEESIREAFENTTIESFASAYPGIKLTSLQKGGIKNVQQLQQRISDARGIAGIGDKTEDVILRSLSNYRYELASDLSIRFDVTRKDSLQTKLLQAVYSVDKEKGINEGAVAISKYYYENVADKVQKVSPKWIWALEWFFKSSAQKAAYADNLGILQSFNLTYGLCTNQLQNELSKIQIFSEEEVWDDFSDNAARYYASLEPYFSIGIAKNSPNNFLPAEIIRKIEGTELQLENLNVSLRGWQYFGAKYAIVQKKVLIGDEMGLGKTIEAIAVMAHLSQEGKSAFIVVCPASIVINWMREIEKHSQLKPVMVHGADRVRSFLQWQNEGGVAITTYETIQRLKHDQLEKIDLLVVDEAHYVKNPKAQRSQTIYSMTNRSENVLYLTGTPLENRLLEMVNLVGKLQPDITKNMENSVQHLDSKTFQEKIAPVYLRRNKEDVLAELPDLTQVEEWLPFGNEEDKIYRDAVLTGEFMLMRRAGWQGKTKNKSPKLNRLIEICDEAAANGKKVIVFSFFKSVISTICTELGGRTLTPITGEASSAQRQEILDAFKSSKEKNVLVSQIQAGGIGLNIQSASIVVFCEPQVKPTLETQAIARSYRMGQTQNVFVYRLLTENSIDERMMEMLESKQKLFDDYAKDSYITDHTAAAKDISEKSMVKKIVDMERERLQVEAT